MGKFIDLTGQGFGSWKLLRREGSNPEPMAYWICRCKCGQTKPSAGRNLRNGKSTKCVRCADRDRGSETNHKIGDKVGRWTILSNDRERKRYHCRCECGTTGLRQATNLATGYRLVGENTGCKSCNEVVWAAKTRKRRLAKRCPGLG